MSKQIQIKEFFVSSSSKLNKPSKINKHKIEIELIEEEPIVDSYTTIRKSYKNNEFIPCRREIVMSIINHHFASAEVIHSFSENHLLLKIPIKDILHASIINWEYNRPPDMSRCPDIARYMYNSKKPVDTMIYLSYKNSNDCFEVLDGIHRLTALRIIHQENVKPKPIDFITPEHVGDYEFGSNNDANWLYDQYLIVNIRFNAILGDLIEIFKTLNKSQNVPDIYIRDVDKEKRDIIEAIANEYQIRYKKNFSSSANPIVGNTNRNKFVNLLDKIYDKYNFDNTQVIQFKQVLENANTRISMNVPTKVSIDSRLKARETGCYLFLYKNDKLEELI